MSHTAADPKVIAKELVAVRQRGLAEIDLRSSGQRRSVLPELESLARAHTPGTGLLRIELIRRLLHDGLAAYRSAGYVQTAALITDLFFDDGSGETLSHQSAGALLDAAEKKHGSTNFEKRRRSRIREFAAFLVDYVQPPPAVKKRPRRRVSKGTIAFTFALLYLFGFGISEGIGRALHKDPWGLYPAKSRARHTSASVTPSRSMPSASTGPMSLRVGVAGGGSNAIPVYPGVQNSAQDLTAKGTVRSGQVVRAVCRTTGRTITTRAVAGKQPQRSDVWLQIQGGVTATPQYIALAYINLSSAELAALPACSDSP